jgi:hypothetical protein
MATESGDWYTEIASGVEAPRVSPPPKSAAEKPSRRLKSRPVVEDDSFFTVFLFA